MAAGDGIDAVVPGCTELPLLSRGMKLPVPCVDVMRVHIDALVRLVLEG